MSDDQGTVFGAFSALLGYVGGQAATSAIFERFLWPQRHFSSLSVYDLPRMGLLYSMAGPIGSIALDAIDTAYKFGLFNGAVQGHMLGTHFYQDIGWTYTLHQLGKEPQRESQIRNCIWVQALLSMPLPSITQEGSASDAENGSVAAKGLAKPVRSRVAVNHLMLAKATPEDLANRELPFIVEETRHVGLKTWIGILLTESTGIGIMICVAVIKRSLWSIIFIIPLILRLASAFFALHREGITDIPDTVASEQSRDWEIQVPAIEGKFILISGPPTIANQFFRHYGHPVRSRYREVIQLFLTVAFATYFPVGVLCQVTWMPMTIQYIWTIWQVWMVIGMHFDRYTQKGLYRSTTDATLGRAFTKNNDMGNSDQVIRSTILFGQHRKGSNVVKATLDRSVANSFGDGKKMIKALVTT